MAKSALANLCWIPDQAGGRHPPPAGPCYVTVVKFKADQIYWPHQAWSLVVEFLTAPDDKLYNQAKVYFLMPDSEPEAWLQVSRRFLLLEGARAVAASR